MTDQTKCRECDSALRALTDAAGEPVVSVVVGIRNLELDLNAEHERAQASEASLLALRASVEAIVQEMKRDTEVPQEFGAGWRIVRRWADQLSTLIDPSR